MTNESAFVGESGEHSQSEQEGEQRKNPHPAAPWPLALEHRLLGAKEAKTSAGVRFVESYGHETKEWEAAKTGCALADLSDLATLLIGGTGAHSFVSTVFSADPPKPGKATYGLVLSGDGSVVAPVLLAAVDVDDYLCFTMAGLAHGLSTWLEALRSLKGEKGPLWGDVAIERPAQRLTCLALVGPLTKTILSDYLSKDETLPEPGAIKRLLLDRIVSTCIGLSWPKDAWLIFLPAALAASIWRSLLSFPEVTPVGTPVLWGRLVEGRAGFKAYLEAPVRPYAPKELGLEKLLRKSGGFVGARSLGIER